MEGGGANDELLKLGNLGDYKDLGDLVYITSAAVVALDATVALNKFGSIGGVSLNTYFDTFGLEGMLANVMLVVLLFQVARVGYTTIYASGGRVWSPLVFVAFVLVAQLLHDILFYFGAINTLPTGVNTMIDALKGYAKENGGRALGGHITFMILVATLAMLYKEFSPILLGTIVIIALYLLPYLINSRGPMPPPPPPPPPKKQEAPVQAPFMGAMW
jgi:hypothetical protein